MRAHLAHVAQHQPAWGGQAAQHLDGREHGIGVGVVAVVHQRGGAAGPGQGTHLRPSLHRTEGLQPLLDGGQGFASGLCADSGGQRVAHVVQPRHGQAHAQARGVQPQFDIPGLGRGVPVRLRAGIGLPLQREGAHLPGAGHLAPHRGHRVVGRKHRDARGGQGRQHGAVLLRHGLHAGHELLVFALRVVDERHRRRRQPGQLPDLPRVVHAQFHHAHAVPDLVVLAHPQQGQRQADVVVQIALGGERSGAVASAQDGRDHLRHRGLAVAAGHRDQRQVETVPPCRGQRLQGRQRIGHLQATQARLGQTTLGQGRHRARLARCSQEVMGIKALAAQGHEQVAGLQAAGVGMHPLERERAIAHQHRAGQQRMGLGQGHHGCAPTGCAVADARRACKAAVASVTSQKGCFTPAISCVCS